MRITKLVEAKAEAERFLKKVYQLERSIGLQTDDHIYTSKESGSVKRASMDLTRALAELRKSGY